MSEASRSVQLNINGYEIIAHEAEDIHGKYLSIPALNKSFSNICGSFIANKYWIKEIDYEFQDNQLAIIKAYY